MFAAMLESLKYEVISTLSKVRCGCRKKSRRWNNSVVKRPSAAQMQQLSHQSDDEAAARIWRRKPANVKWAVTIRARAAPAKVQTVPRPSELRSDKTNKGAEFCAFLWSAFNEKLQIAVGIIRNPQGEIFITQRAADAHMANKLEFPAGKLNLMRRLSRR